MDQKRQVVIGLLGTVLDGGTRANRWAGWRPSVSICQQEELLVHRFELIFDRKFARLCRQVQEDILAVSPETAVITHELPPVDPWDFEGVYAALHDFARSYPFNPEEEEYLIHITTGTHVAQICLFLLTEAHYFPGKLLQTSPPDRRDPDSPGSYRLIDLDLSQYDRLASRFVQEQQELASFLKSGIETRNAPFNHLIDQIERVATNSAAPILLMGPTGAGKSRLARRIYELKKNRRQLAGAFIEVNCATIRGDGAMSAMFGHVKGAFTGAAHDRAGLLRAADRGLLFLDEIGELGLDEQAMLLRALEEKRFLPVGSDKEAASEFQLIAGTNQDLARAVRDGRFREDLFARVNLWTFCLPGLRDRREDIEPNLRYELEQFARVAGVNVTFNKEANQRFLRFATSNEAQWSGNFRDLNAAVTRMATLAAGGRISVEIVEQEIERLKRSWSSPPDPQTTTDLAAWIGADELVKIDPFERVQLAEVVRVCRCTRSLSEAGRQLFAISRQSKATPNDADRLRKYLARFKLDWQSLQDAAV